MKNTFLQRPFLFLVPAIVLSLALFLPLISPDHGQAAGSDDAPLLLAAGSGGNLPVIPRVPDRSKRAPRRGAPASAVTAPDPVPAPKAETVPPAPSRMASPEPAKPMVEPLAPDTSKPKVMASPKEKAAPLPFYEDDVKAPVKAEAPRRGKRYDPNLVKDPSAAPPQVTGEIIVEGSAPVESERPVWMVEVPDVSAPMPAAPVSPVAAMPAEARIAAGEPAPGTSAVPPYSTEPLAVSSPVPAPVPAPSTAVADASGHLVGGHGAYPGAVTQPWPSQDAEVYTGVAPERIASAVPAEMPRDRLSQLPDLPPERISDPLPMELPLHNIKPLRPRR
jgi:hypothetical protein